MKIFLPCHVSRLHSATCEQPKRDVFPSKEFGTASCRRHRRSCRSEERVGQRARADNASDQVALMLFRQIAKLLVDDFAYTGECLNPANG